MCVILPRMNATLHLRIPGELDRAIRSAALGAGISVSKWVRWSLRDQIDNPGGDYEAGSTPLAGWVRHHAGLDALEATNGARQGAE